MKKNKYKLNEGLTMPDETPTETSDVTLASSSSISSSVSFVRPAQTPTPTVKVNQMKELPKEPSKKAPTNVDKLAKLITAYTTAYQKKESTMIHWINLCNYLNRINDPKVYQEFYAWFARNLEELTNPAVALLGVHNIQDARTKTMVSSIHQSFEELARVIRTRSKHYRFTLKSMRAMCISESLGRWILRKAEQV